MPDSSRTLDDIDNAELKTQLKKWVEEEGIEANIQLQMKRNLIEKMCRTTLGKQIALKLQTQQGIVLSPLVLVLNTLVAEFLYTQNCHFSLSIFTNEVPFKNTLPDFTRSSKFRLSRIELGEIFEALGIAHYTGLVEKYESIGNEQGSRSLLYIVFKSILSSVKAQETKLRQLHRADRRKANVQTLMKQLNVEKLHRSVGKLLHRLKTVGKAIAQLEESQRQQKQAPTGAGGDQSKNEDDEAPSLRMCSENVTRLVERLESCTKMFEQLVQVIQQQRTEDRKTGKTTNNENNIEDGEHKHPRQLQKTYTDFLHELKTTEHGKRYVAKLQKQVLKMLDKEKTQMEATYASRVEQLEVEYKKKIGNTLSTKVLAPMEVQSPRKDLPNVSDERHDESQHFMRKIDEKLDLLYAQERNVDNKLATLRNDLQKQEQRQSRYFESIKSTKTKENKLQVLHTVERALLATFEDETNVIIQNAKQTIEQLEQESDKINLSFQRYLQKQREEKRKLIDDKVQIWTRYNDEKLELNQRELLGADEGDISQHIPAVATLCPDVTVRVEKAGDGVQFENPFRSFNPLKYLRSSRPSENYMVDVAIATTSDVGLQTQAPTVDKTRPFPAARTTAHNEKLSDALAKDTRDLRQSIEENLLKLDEMSKLHSKSNNSSGKNRTFEIEGPPNGSSKPNGGPLPTVEATSNRSLDDCSSTELGLSDGEIIVSQGRHEPSLTKLDTTRDLLDYTSQNVINEQADDQLLNIASFKPRAMAASFSDLSISSASVTSKLSYEKSLSLDKELDRISTGVPTKVSESSWT